MSLLKLKSAPMVLIEEDDDVNVLPLIRELAEQETNLLNIFCFEQPGFMWRNIFRNKPDVVCYEDFNIDYYDKYINGKTAVILDSVNQLALHLGWNECFSLLQRLQKDTNVAQLIVILHKDCLSHSSRLQLHMNHIASAIVSFIAANPCKVHIQLKKGGKLVQSEEVLTYDTRTSTLKSAQLVKATNTDDKPEIPSPSSLATFKIDMDQSEKFQKSQLKLPYMNKIHEGESKVYYEPDAVDDWDEEDPDEDLDI